ncbi:MAG: MBL fold metallo-hydrolase [Caulobacteraceae bacterium]|nr:MBL fold metallo-hydrolase [Caulobacteraceae bacterium]
MRKRILLGVLALVLIAGGGLYLMRGELAMRAMSRIYAQAMGRDALAELPDGLHLGLCGSGSPMPDPTRAGPCVAVVAGQRLFVVDSGTGSTRNLSLMNLPPARVEAVFLTHYHSDHIADLGELMLQRWAGGPAKRPVPVYGPTGVDQVVGGFEAAYALDRGYRVAHHGPAVMPPGGFGGEPRAFAASPQGPNVVLINEPDLKVTAFPVPHDPATPAVGYIFEYKGRKLVVSGDTALSQRLETAARGADLLAHEGLSHKLVGLQREAAVKAGRDNLAHIMHDILSYHTDPKDVGALAQRAGVREVLFYHVIPPLPLRALEGPFTADARKLFKGRLAVGHDGDFVSLPAGGKKIEHSNRLRTFR